MKFTGARCFREIGYHYLSMPTRQEIHDENRDRSRFENELINQRLTWFGTLQGLLIAALAFAWKDATVVAVVICFLGIFVSVSIGVATCRANKKLDQVDPENRNGALWWLMPGRFIPLVFVVGWVAILVLWYRTFCASVPMTRWVSSVPMTRWVWW